MPIKSRYRKLEIRMDDYCVNQACGLFPSAQSLGHNRECGQRKVLLDPLALSSILYN
jgi:hypothetical protein